MKRINWLIVLVALLLPGLVSAGPIDVLEPGHWYMVPNSRLDSVAAVPPIISQSLYDQIRGNSNVKGLMKKWSGGTYDTTRDRLIVWGGGHRGYGGNEVYAFDINSLKWERLTLPSAPASGCTVGNEVPCTDVYPDGTPASRHTYDGLTYVPPPIDSFFAYGRGYYTTGNSAKSFWAFDLETLKWQRKVDTPDDMASFSAYDPITGVVWVQARNHIMKYDPVGNTWTQGNYNDWYPGRGTMSIDPGRRKLVRIGNGIAHVWDISKFPPVRTDLATAGDTEIIAKEAPGLVFDPVGNQFVAWSGGADVYTMNMDTLVWVKRVPAKSNTVIPTGVTAEGGTFGRFQYIPSKNAFIAVNATDENVYIYKLSNDIGVGIPLTPAKPGVQVK